MTVKNIIFDLGGVILDLDFERMAHQFNKLGIPEFEDYFTLKKQADFFEALELGALHQKYFVTVFEKKQRSMWRMKR